MKGIPSKVTAAEARRIDGSVISAVVSSQCNALSYFSCFVLWMLYCTQQSFHLSYFKVPSCLIQHKPLYVLHLFFCLESASVMFLIFALFNFLAAEPSNTGCQEPPQYSTKNRYISHLVMFKLQLQLNSI